MSILTNAEQIRDEVAAGANTALRVGGNLVEIANDLVAKQTVITANTAKVGITTGQAAAIAANTAKVGITTGQASAITANSAKVGISTDQASAIVANTTSLLALKITVELDSTLANFFYAPQAIKIASVTNISGTPTVVIRVNTVVYVFGTLIAAGALIALTSNVIGVVNLNGTYE